MQVIDLSKESDEENIINHYCMYTGNNKDKGYCTYITEKNEECGSYASKQFCVMKNDSEVLCSMHYFKIYCEPTEWDYELSRCANLRCDELDIGEKARSKINQKNICKILNMDNDSHHISDARIKKVKADTKYSKKYDSELSSESELVSESSLESDETNNNNKNRDNPVANLRSNKRRRISNNTYKSIYLDLISASDSEDLESDVDSQGNIEDLIDYSDSESQQSNEPRF